MLIITAKRFNRSGSSALGAAVLRYVLCEGRVPQLGLDPVFGSERAKRAGCENSLPRLASIPRPTLVAGASIASFAFLGLLDAIGARGGGANVGRATLRVTFWGARAMALTAGNRRDLRPTRPLLGVVGAIFGGWLFDLFGGTGVTGIDIDSIYSACAAVVGTTILLALYHVFFRRRML